MSTPFQPPLPIELPEQPASAPTRRLLSAREAADYLGVSVSTFYRGDRRDDLPPAKRIGGRKFWSPDVLDAWLREAPGRNAKREQGGAA